MYRWKTQKVNINIVMLFQLCCSGMYWVGSGVVAYHGYEALPVSILIVVDVPLEVKMEIMTKCIACCFNPYCSGCTAGSYTVPAIL